MNAALIVFPMLNSHEAMSKWKTTCGSRATYKHLLETFISVNHTEGAEAVCSVLKRRGGYNMACMQ